MNPQSPYQPQQPTPGQQPQQQPVGQQFYAVPGQNPQQPIPAGYTPIPTAPIKRPPNPALKWVIMTFVFIFTTLAVGGVSVWAYMNYIDQKDNVDSKVAVATAAAVKDQADKDAADFLQKEKQPNRQFVGPDDYGRVAFDYPKTWSVYVAKDATTGGTYQAYFNPGVVPYATTSQQFALRVIIEDKDYDKVIESYKTLVSRGDLSSSVVKADEQNGTRLTGAFSKDVHGSAVIFKIRDKTVTIRTDAETFLRDNAPNDPAIGSDFDTVISTITFNK